MEPSNQAAVFMRVFNADGSESGACGNATRCIAVLVARETGQSAVPIETQGGLLNALVNSDDSVTVDMGIPRFGWNEIPLSRPFDDTAALDFSVPAGEGRRLEQPGVVSIGNPHCVFWVDDLYSYDFAEIGPRIENDPLFPERVNVSFAQILSPDAIRLVVWERGAGLTKACGTGACATAIASMRRNLTDRKVTVSLPGGNLVIEWKADIDHILMTGPWSLDYEGVYTPKT
jgi:diaminopimelate epimerase